MKTGGYCQDKKAVFEHLFHTYYEQLHRYAFTILKHNEEAQDVVQAVFVKLWEKWEEIDMEQSARAYLYKWVHNRCLNTIRHEKIRANYVLSKAADQADLLNTIVETAVQQKELNHHIQEAIEALPPQCKLIFQKSRFEDKKYQEIAAELGISPKTVEVQMGKALKILREKLAAIARKP